MQFTNCARTEVAKRETPTNGSWGFKLIQYQWLSSSEKR